MFHVPCSNTFTAIQEQTDQYWHFDFYSVCKEYYDKPLLAPPLIIISLVWAAIKKMFIKCRCLKDDDQDHFSKCLLMNTIINLV